MTKTQAIAQAMRGSVVEDQGYRGIIAANGGHLRYHSAQGVAIVELNGRRWKTIKQIIPAHKLDEFLIEQGILKGVKSFNWLHRIVECTGGEVVERFHAGGGVILLDGIYLRISPITGLAFVRKALRKWRLVQHICTKESLYELLTHDRITVKDIQEVQHGVHTDRGRDPVGNQTIEKSKDEVA